jgi:hypothetical protein
MDDLQNMIVLFHQVTVKETRFSKLSIGKTKGGLRLKITDNRHRPLVLAVVFCSENERDGST